MAKVVILNTREHIIHLNATPDPQKPIPSVSIPCARKHDLTDKLAPGRIEIEGEHLAAFKKSKVVQHYFKEGWLREENKEKPAA